MNYKVQGAIKNNKKYFLLFFILWVVFTLLLVVPIAYSIVVASPGGQFNISEFIVTVPSAIANPGLTFSNIFTENYISMFFDVLAKFSIVYLIIFVIGMFRTAPRHEYTDIEHGSSDWCEGGEQYRTLSRTKGILLAQDHYLPIDKRGNTNVLVVGRIWIW